MFSNFIGDLVSEKSFEDRVVAYLRDVNGFVQRFDGDFNEDFVCDSGVLVNFIQKSQPQVWEYYKDHFGVNAELELLKDIDKKRNSMGLVDLLRNGFKNNGGPHIYLMFNKPVSKNNPVAWDLYEKNVFSVIRQLHYSADKNHSVDVVLFLNGFPLIVVELKQQLKGQSVEEAVMQFKRTRSPRDGLFVPRVGSLLYFAVDDRETKISTGLAGDKTKFMPFNRGYNMGAGNPPTTDDGYSTSYLWERFWTKDMLLDLVANYLFIKTDEDGKKLAAPRYHQWDCIDNIEHDVVNNSRKNFLIQHSAGSGKTNTIAWLAHKLSTLHDDEGNLRFDKVIVITDRKVIDNQLQEAVEAFQQTKGAVCSIDHNSRQLKEALQSGARIVVSTIQKFSYINDVLDATSDRQKKFAIIIDEAHSSQAGENAKNVKSVLDVDEERDILDDLENIDLQRRGENLSFFAFTATPKDTTLKLFGTLGDDGIYHPYHLYSMRQAVEEGYILYVLKNYRSFRVGREAAYDGDSNEVIGETKDIGAQVKRVKLKVNVDVNLIQEKSKVILDDFVPISEKMLGGTAKGMVVCGSREEAAKYYEVISKMISDYPDKWGNVKPLVAYSGVLQHYNKINGDVADVYEHDWNGFSEDEVPEKFDKFYNLLIVANKYQTGFDQPKLCAMYVDKTMGSEVVAVQTFSRLNRMSPGKREVFIIDFVNDVNNIRNYFQKFYGTTETADKNDEELLLNNYETLNNFGIYSSEEIESFYLAAKEARLDPDNLSNKLLAILEIAGERFKNLDDASKNQFRKIVGEFLRLYNFLNQRLKLDNHALYKTYLFLYYFKHLIRVQIDNNIETEWIDEVKLSFVELKEILVSEDENPLTVGSKDDKLLNPGEAMTDHTKSSKEYEPLTVAEVVDTFNKRFGFSLSDKHYVNVVPNVVEELAKDDKIITFAENNELLAFQNKVVEGKITSFIALNQDKIDTEFFRLFWDNGNFRESFVEVVSRELYYYIRHIKEQKSHDPIKIIVPVADVLEGKFKGGQIVFNEETNSYYIHDRLQAQPITEKVVKDFSLHGGLQWTNEIHQKRVME